MKVNYRSVSADINEAILKAVVAKRTISSIELSEHEWRMLCYEIGQNWFPDAGRVYQGVPLIVKEGA